MFSHHASPSHKNSFLQLLYTFTVQYFSSAKLLPTHISSNLDVNLLYYLIFCLSTNKGRVTGWPWGHRQISEMRQVSLKFITAKPLIEARVLIELGSSTVGRLLVGKYARQGAAWQAGMLHGCQQKPPQIVWEPISFLCLFTIFTCLYSARRQKSAGALPSTSRLFFWTSSLPNPAFNSAAKSASQCANHSCWSALHGAVQSTNLLHSFST